VEATMQNGWGRTNPQPLTSNADVMRLREAVL
jgi:hypothetical protein